MTKWFQPAILTAEDEALEKKIESAKHAKKEEDYSKFYELALDEAKKSGCLRRKYGCVIVKSGKVISSGYNRTSQDVTKCAETEEGCKRFGEEHNSGNYLNCPSVHAEVDAIVKMSISSLENAVIVLAGYDVKNDELVEIEECEPCPVCKNLIGNIGGMKIVCLKDLKDKL